MLTEGGGRCPGGGAALSPQAVSQQDAKHAQTSERATRTRAAVYSMIN
jgi:hypothetical protein